MKSFLLALQFLTIIPVKNSFIATNKQLGYSVVFYPFIGLLIGCVLIATSICLYSLPLPLQSILILILWVGLTGGLHLDGLADCADAWVGGFGNKQRSLDIMKDPAAGPVAVVLLVLILILKLILIYYLLERKVLIALLLTPILGRLAILIMMQTTRYIRKEGLGVNLVVHLPQNSVMTISISVLLIGMNYLGLIVIMLMIGLLLLISYHAKKRLGGVTGDVYGASVELVEVSILLGVLL